MKEITLDQPKEVLKVNIGKKSYSIPLAGSLPFVDAMKLRELKKDEQVNFIIEFFRKSIGEDVFKTLTRDEVEMILLAWSDESQKEQGATPGES